MSLNLHFCTGNDKGLGGDRIVMESFMTGLEFDGHMSELKTAVLCAFEHHFAARQVPFDLKAFLRNTQVDLDQFLKEAYFYGAEVFPVESP